MDWFPLALACAFSFASADAATKRFLPDYSGWELVAVRFGVPAVLLAPVTLIYPLPPVPAVFWVWVGVLVPLELLAMWLYVLAIRDSPLHLTLPYLAFTPVFNVLTGYCLLGETLSALGLLGILMVVSGAYVLNLHHLFGNGRVNLWEPFRAVLRERGSRIMLLVGAIYSLTSVMGKGAMQYATPESFGAFYYTLIGAIVVAALAVRHPESLRMLGRRPAAHVLVGFLMAVMVVTHFLAVARVEVAYMIAVKRTSLLFGILYGALLFGEGDVRRNLLAGCLMTCGVALVVLA